MRLDDCHFDLPLFRWTPPVCQIIPFPLTARVGRIQEVARKLSTKSKRQADFYARQVTEGMFSHLSRIGVPEHQQDEMVGAFMSEVYTQMDRLPGPHHHSRPDGAA